MPVLEVPVVGSDAMRAGIQVLEVIRMLGYPLLLLYPCCRQSHLPGCMGCTTRLLRRGRMVC
jgi:hypothetical protein